VAGPVIAIGAATALAQAIARGASEHDWPPIEGELRASWRSLRDAV
jgi:hypothetical protein